MSDEYIPVSFLAEQLQPNARVFATIPLEAQAPLTVSCRVVEVKGKFHYVDFADPDEGLADLYFQLEENMRGPWKVHVADDRVTKRAVSGSPVDTGYMAGVWYGFNRDKQEAVISLPAATRASLVSGFPKSRQVRTPAPVSVAPSRAKTPLQRGM